MRYSKSTAALVAALTISSVAAGPTRRHVHHHQHAKKDVDYSAIDYSNIDWEHMDIDWASAYSAGLAAAKATPTPTPTPAASSTPAVVEAAAVTSAAASVDIGDAIGDAISTAAAGISDVIDDVLSIFDNVVGYANDITSFGSEVAASGSTGDFYYGNYGNPYGHNMMKVSSKEGHSYTAEFINTSGKSMSIFVWNKVGSDKRVLSGSALAPKDTALTFALAPGASQIVAFQENSQVGAAQACSETTASGAFKTTWAEMNFVSTGSGYDVSAINNPNNDYDMTMTSEEAPQCTSSRTENFWLTDTQPIGTSDGSCYIAQKSATITIKMGGTVSV